MPHPPADVIRLRGVRQNNLQGLDLDLPLGELIVITGVSGSGKSSLAFDTLYAEGQRRYVETFSPYARQFLDRLDRPRAARIEGIPPAIAIDQTNPVRTARSTVGTMTELAAHLALLLARAGRLFCRGCGRSVHRDRPEGIWATLLARAGTAATRALICFDVPVPAGLGLAEVRAMLAQQGYVRRLAETPERITVIADRLRLTPEHQGRGLEALETALARGHGRLAVWPLGEDGSPAPTPWRFSADLHCPDCDIGYREPQPALFSFNSPVGACPTCRGFGRTIGIDWSLVVPDPDRSLLDGAIRPIQSDGYSEVQEDLIGFAHRRGVPVDLPWRSLTDADRAWVLEGEGEWEAGVWYGIRRFFDWLESKSYKMHVRVLLSRYRAYDTCTTCGGARLQDEALDWRLGDHALADAVLERSARFRHGRIGMPALTWAGLPGLNLHDLNRLPLARLRDFFAGLHLPGQGDQALDLLLTNIRARLDYLTTVGLGYLTLDRQSRTLSGGEVQRINLTTALGTALVNTLFVLDEPSIGLHPRDMDRIIGILLRLRDQGNTALVVEHDPAVMRAADRIIDLGPGPGERGGRLLCNGPPAALMDCPDSLTGAWLAGRRRLTDPRPPRPWTPGEPALRLRGARAQNLQNLTLDLPLHRLVVLTGVSGSGKSTLLEEVLFRHLARLKGHPEGLPGDCDGLDGAERIHDVLLLDQSPMGRTARSNPASVLGVLEPLRKLFAATPAARERGLGAAHFSFNAGPGRCPTCGGAGFELVEMQFLADVLLRCPDCDGRRFRPEVLAVRLPGMAGGPADDGAAADDARGEQRAPGPNIAEVLEMTAAEAAQAFVGQPEVVRALAPLLDMGLEYLRLGQPVTTLSGGEAQRLKLAAHLAKSLKPARRRGAGLLFLLDEPTTGLHFEDIDRLLQALRRLLDAGHSLILIEHHLAVIAAADWVIDLGPEGGDQGGALVCAGPPARIMAHPTSHTGRALRAAADGRLAAPAAVRETPAQPRPVVPAPEIQVHHAREHNLKDLSLTIPRDRLVVITGVSGSGKSTLAFDILFAEGQRRYLESLNAWARQFVQPAARADVEAVFGLPPTVAIAQRTSRAGTRSTVGTLTEIHHYLRLLFAKLGTQYCPGCNLPIESRPRAAIAAQIRSDFPGRTLTLLAPLVLGRKGLYRDLAAAAARDGVARLLVDGVPVPVAPWPRLDRFKDHHIDLPIATLTADEARWADRLEAELDRALDRGRGLVRVLPGGLDDPAGPRRTYATARTCPGCGAGFTEPDPRLFSWHTPYGWCPTCQGTGLALPASPPVRAKAGDPPAWLAPEPELDPDQAVGPCPTCHGARLRPAALAVRLGGPTIAQIGALSVAAAADFFAGLEFDDREAAIGAEPVQEIMARLAFLRRVGLDYLTLDRGAPTLSGGEAQRIRLAAALGTNLRGVCHVLDEPSIGLHPRDNARLLALLAELRDQGNSVIVVEHDAATIRQADEVLDLGPGAGQQGGRLVARGSAAALMANPASVTGRYLAGQGRAPLSSPRPWDDQTPALLITGARLHNLQDLTVAIPLGRLVCVTGVSGSGKSTLVRDVIGASLRGLLGPGTAGGPTGRRRGAAPAPAAPVGCRAISGWQSLQRVLEVDQSPIGKTPRSCPATYVGCWDAIRRLFAAAPEARVQGWSAGRFSFNTPGGRCEVCAGQGVQRLEMSFLPDVTLTCEACGGTRFDAETRAIRYLGKGIHEVLAMSVDQAAELFAAHPAVRRPLELLQAIGLGYLSLGQPSPTLSGGEAQRLKLVTELVKAQPGARSDRPTLYLLDEPTVGLHMADVARLIDLLHRLVDAGHSLLVIEHDLDLIAAADWVIDLGPEGGVAGGRLVDAGPPARLAATGHGHTALALRTRGGWAAAG